MSTYASPLDMTSRYGAEELAQRTDRAIPRLVTDALLLAWLEGGDTSEATADELVRLASARAALQRVLQDAADTIDSYVSGRYTLPLTPVPAVLKRLACDLARYYLYDDQVTDTVKARHDAAMKVLTDIATGKVSLGTDDAGQAPISSNGAEMVTQGRVWQRDRSTGFL